jgi:hypothetical protein
MDDEHSFGALLRQHRAATTQEDLAERGGLIARVLRTWNVAWRFPYPDTVARLSDALQLGSRNMFNCERQGGSSDGRRLEHSPDRAAAPTDPIDELHRT